MKMLHFKIAACLLTSIYSLRTYAADDVWTVECKGASVLTAEEIAQGPAPWELEQSEWTVGASDFNKNSSFGKHVVPVKLTTSTVRSGLDKILPSNWSNRIVKEPGIGNLKAMIHFIAPKTEINDSGEAQQKEIVIGSLFIFDDIETALEEIPSWILTKTGPAMTFCYGKKSTRH